jgi:hypothetical protein
LITMIAALFITACSGSVLDGDDATPPIGSTAEEVPETTMAPTTTMAEAREAGNASDANAAPTVATVDPQDLGRSIVYTASLEVVVDDVVAAGEQVRVAMEGIGGLLFGQETTTGTGARSVLTIKVRPEDFQEALARLSGIGTLVSQSVSADDVTERVVDLQSRITTAEASVERLRSFLEGATDLEDVATLEAQLLERETNLELLRGQLRTLEDQVALATIVLVLREPVEPFPEPALRVEHTAYAGHDEGQACPGIDELSIDEGEAFTSCYVVTNTGTTDLADVRVRDDGLDARPRDLIAVEGDPEGVVPVGGRLVLAFETDADYPSWGDPSVDATAVDDVGEPIRVAVEVEVEHLSLDVTEDTSLPGFVEALKSGWAALQRGWGVVVVVAGAIIPWLWAPVLLGLAYWWLRRRSGRRAPEADDRSLPE